MSVFLEKCRGRNSSTLACQARQSGIIASSSSLCASHSLSDAERSEKLPMLFV